MTARCPQSPGSLDGQHHGAGRAATANRWRLDPGLRGAWAEDLPCWPPRAATPHAVPATRVPPARSKYGSRGLGRFRNGRPEDAARHSPPTGRGPEPRGCLHGGMRGEKQVETSASVCLRPVLPGGGSRVSCSSSRPGPRLASSRMAVSSRLLGETERRRHAPRQPVSTGKSKGCGDTHRPVTPALCEARPRASPPLGSRPAHPGHRLRGARTPAASCGGHSQSQPAGRTAPRPGAARRAGRSGKRRRVGLPEAPGGQQMRTEAVRDRGRARLRATQRRGTDRLASL